MHKTLMIALTLLISAAWLQAQDTSKSASATTTIQGCLSSSGERYYLTDSSGKKLRLGGYANKLKDHVGHEVQLTGTPGVHTTDTTVQGLGSTAKETPDFMVKSVKHIADTCTTK